MGRWTFASYGFLLVDFLALSIVGKLILAFDTLGSTRSIDVGRIGRASDTFQGLGRFGKLELGYLAPSLSFADERGTDCLTYALLCILAKTVQSHDHL
jgi:hypothetical protein